MADNSPISESIKYNLGMTTLLSAYHNTHIHTAFDILKTFNFYKHIPFTVSPPSDLIIAY